MLPEYLSVINALVFKANPLPVQFRNKLSDDAFVFCKLHFFTFVWLNY